MSLKTEMKDCLREHFSGLSDDDDSFNFDMEAAIYWFCNDWHGGQNSELYGILSRSDYRPARSYASVNDEPEMVTYMYDELEVCFQEFTN